MRPEVIWLWSLRVQRSFVSILSTGGASLSTQVKVIGKDSDSYPLKGVIGATLPGMTGTKAIGAPIGASLTTRCGGGYRTTS
jgi:hypothetical protein